MNLAEPDPVIQMGDELVSSYSQAAVHIMCPEAESLAGHQTTRIDTVDLANALHRAFDMMTTIMI